MDDGYRFDFSWVPEYMGVFVDAFVLTLKLLV